MRPSVLTYRVVVEPLLWGNEEQIDNIKNNYDTFDFIIGSDVLYEPLNYPDLLQTIRRLSGRDTVIIFGYPKRHLGEEQFLREASQFFDVSSHKIELENRNHVHIHICQLRHIKVSLIKILIFLMNSIINFSVVL